MKRLAASSVIAEPTFVENMLFREVSELEISILVQAPVSVFIVKAPQLLKMPVPFRIIF
jgi:hypothetical protein